MSKKVKEYCEGIQARVRDDGRKIINRFSEKNFKGLMKAMINDNEFKHVVVNVKNGEIESTEDIFPAAELRNFLRRILEKAGIDKSESAKVLDDSFKIENIDGLYEFMDAAIMTYMECGNRFDFKPTEDFRGGIYLIDVPETETETSQINPRTKENMGRFKTTKKAHKKLGAKSPCPKFLATRTRIGD
nr:MAG TPA: hypothetical protein [Caudoviricetes sp.]